MTKLAATTRSDLAHTPPNRPSRITMVTRTHIELRKLLDTRASASILGVMVGLVVIAVAVLGAFSPDAVDLRRLTSEGSAPLVFLLPILGLLSVTGEWRHRTTLWTYALDPHRSRVLTAKLIAVGLVTVAVTLVTLLLAAVVVLLAGEALPGADATFDVSTGLLWAVGGMTLVGVGLGASLLNAPLALAVFFLLPQLIPQLLRTWSRTADLAPYVDAYAVFLGGMADRPAAQLPEIASVIALWVVLPLAIGYIRNARRDA